MVEGFPDTHSCIKIGFLNYRVSNWHYNLLLIDLCDNNGVSDSGI